MAPFPDTWHLNHVRHPLSSTLPVWHMWTDRVPLAVPNQRSRSWRVACTVGHWTVSWLARLARDMRRWTTWPLICILNKTFIFNLFFLFFLICSLNLGRMATDQLCFEFLLVDFEGSQRWCCRGFLATKHVLGPIILMGHYLHHPSRMRDCPICTFSRR